MFTRHFFVPVFFLPFIIYVSGLAQISVTMIAWVVLDESSEIARVTSPVLILYALARSIVVWIVWHFEMKHILDWYPSKIITSRQRILDILLLNWQLLISVSFDEIRRSLKERKSEQDRQITRKNIWWRTADLATKEARWDVDSTSSRATANGDNDGDDDKIHEKDFVVEKRSSGMIYVDSNRSR